MNISKSITMEKMYENLHKNLDIQIDEYGK